MDKNLKKFLSDNDIDTVEKLHEFMRFNLDASIVNHNVAPDIDDSKMSKIDSYFDRIFNTSVSDIERKNYQLYQSDQLANWVAKVSANNLENLKSLDN